MNQLCELCGVEQAFNFHHFIPRTLHSNKWFKERYSRQERAKGIFVCRMCHHTIHDVIPKEKEIGRKYFSLDLLLGHLEIKKYVEWRRRKLRNE
jgi:hypothetical protein